MKDTKYMIDRDKMVRKANNLIQKSRFNLSLQQQKIVLYLISQISPNDNEFKLYEFDIIDFCKVCGINEYSGGNYQELKSAIKEIADKSIWIKTEKGDTLLRWIEKPYINDKSGIIKIRLDEDMKPYLLQLQRNFTKYELIWTLQFNSKYSIRLYELICSIHFDESEIYTREYEIDELRKLVGAENETYNRYFNFKTRVIDPAVKEINENSNKIVTYEPITKRKKVIKLRFSVQNKPVKELIQTRAKIEKEYGSDQLSIWEEMESLI